MNIEIGGNTGVREDFLQVDMYGSPDIRADIRRLPFKHSLDRIFASHVLEHLPDADVIPALKSCRRALRPGGTLELYVPDLPWLFRKFLREKSPGKRWALWLREVYGSQTRPGQFHQTGFSNQRLMTCLTAAGFRQVRVKRAFRKERHGQAEVHAIAVS